MMVEVSPQVRWTEMARIPCAGTLVGLQQVAQSIFQILSHDWIDYRFELQHLIAVSGRVIGVGSYKGIFRVTGKALEGGWPTSGKSWKERPWPSTCCSGVGHELTAAHCSSLQYLSALPCSRQPRP